MKNTKRFLSNIVAAVIWSQIVAGGVHSKSISVGTGVAFCIIGAIIISVLHTRFFPNDDEPKQGP